MPATRRGLRLLRLRVDHDQVVRTARAYNDARIEAILRPSQWVRSERTDMNLCGLSTGSSGYHPATDDVWYQAIAVNEGHLEVLRSLAFRSMITVPLRTANEVIGALTLFYGTSRRSYTPADVAFVEEFTALVVPFVINARLVERQRRVEEALRSSEERLRLAIDAGQLGIWDWNIVTNEVVWSDRVYELHGLVPGSFGGRVEDFAALVHEDDRPHVQAAIADAIAHSGTYEVEFRVSRDGPVRWLATRATVVRDAAGAPLRMVGATYDVTSRVELLAAERLARERLEVLAQAGKLLTSSLDRDATLAAITTAVTPALADWCRVDLLDDAGVLRHTVSHHADPDRARRGAALSKQFRLPATSVGSVAWVAANNKPYTTAFDAEKLAALPPSDMMTFVIENRLRSILSVPLIARGRTLGVLTVLRDDQRARQLGAEDLPLFTELAGRAALALDNARLYAEAERARTDAERANRAKDEFLAILGHELRNPLAPIVSALHLMQMRDDRHPRERSVIERQVAHLSRLVDDLLDVSRIVRGKVEIARTRIDLAEIVGKAVEMTGPLFAQRGLRLEVSRVSPNTWVDGDPVRLAQIVSNLLTNSAKFSSDGGRVDVSLIHHDGRHVLSVRDEGDGITAELLPDVFGLFVQGPQTLHRERGGLGLGLAIVKNLVEQHGGSVEAHSDGAGRGATFVVHLPAAPALAVQPPVSARSDSSPRSGRILIVDDNVDAGELLAELLRIVGYDVTFRSDGAAALEIVGVTRPDVAVLDIGLPGLDGYELARRLRADASLQPLRLIALTGYGLASDRSRASEAGFDLHLVKPVNATSLINALDQLLGR
ncbi:MAG: ATP-binding protein [Myxococcota bacterium]|nr:ATP-binding protein [Myxococcota bacterium]